MPWIEVDADEIVEKTLLDHLYYGEDLTDFTRDALKHLLAFYMVPSDYNVRFGENEWEKIMGLED